MTEDASFGRWLKRRRRALDLTQKELARRAGYSVSALRKVEADELRPSRLLAETLAEHLDVPPERRGHVVRLARGQGTGEPGEPEFTGPETTPILPIAPRPRHNLPHPLTSFIGRERELAELTERLKTARLLTLAGTGGCGKTRLALQVAAEMVDAYVDGVWLVELAALADSRLVAQAVASVLGVREVGGQSMRQTLVAALRPRQLLLVLDNCEHLIAACAELTEELLRRCPRLSVLATSREALGIPGEVTRRVPSLTLPEQGDQSVRREDLAADLLRSEAAQLFVDRARAVEPRFAATSENATAVAEICRRLDGIPLALELAAARLKVLGVEEVAVRLHDRFQLLTAGHRTALPHQQTLRATLDWSYNLLSTTERAVFRWSSVFAGSFCLDAAEAMAADGPVESASQEASALLHRADILDLVSQLVDKSLVLVDQKQAGTRYRLPETVRQYAHERLVEAGEAEAARDRHRHWCLQLAERAKPELIGPQQAAWLDRLETERDNLRAALAWAVERGPVEDALRLAAALWRFFLIRDHPGEGWDWLTRVLAASAEPLPTSSRAEVLEGASSLASWLGNHAAVQWMGEESLAINRALGDHRGTSVALGHLAVCAVTRGDFDRMEEFAVEALAEARQSSDSWATAQAFLIYGANAWYRGDVRVARHRFEECVAIWRDLGDRRAIQGVFVFLGMVTCQEGDYVAARAYLEEALAIGRELRSNARIGEALVGLGDLARLQSDDAKARTLVTMGLGLLKEAGNRERSATALFHLASVARREGDVAEARRLVRECLAIFDETRFRPGVQVALSFCGVLAILRGAFRRGALFFGAGSLKGGHFRLLLPDDLQAYEESRAAARIALGEETFATAYCAGQAMTLPQAVAYAMSEEAHDD